MRDFRGLLPAPDRGYRGAAGAFWFLAVVTVVATARSLIHMFAPDGGASSIAGLDIEVEGGDNLVAMFGQWGLEQLLLALVGWVVIWRYRFLVPFALLLQLLDLLGRVGMGQLKPLTVADAPPGAIGTYVALPLVAVALWFSLPPKDSGTSKVMKSGLE